MGWSEYHADHYKDVWKVDRKAECDSLVKSIGTRYEILKSAVVGSTYFAAIKDEETNRVWAAIVLTRVNTRSYWNFAYKELTEFEGPYDYRCPKTILKLLSPLPADDVWADEWRRKCWQYHSDKDGKD